MSVSPSTIKHGQLILQAFEESISFWCALKADVERHFDDEKRIVNSEGVEVTDVPRHVHRQLLSFLNSQHERVKTIASSGQYIVYVQAQYAIVALIDDQLLRMVRWPHQNEWLHLLLEKTLFSSRNAGHKLIQRVEDLIDSDNKGQQMSPTMKQLAYVYLCVFWQGFRGRLFNNPGKLEFIRSALTEISEHDAIDLGQKHLISQPYLHNRNNDQPGRLAPISRWHRITLVAFFIYLVVSTGLWVVLTMELDEELEEATEQIVTRN